MHLRRGLHPAISKRVFDSKHFGPQLIDIGFSGAGKCQTEVLRGSTWCSLSNADVRRQEKRQSEKHCFR